MFENARLMDRPEYHDDYFEEPDFNASDDQLELELEPSQQLELGFENDVGREPRTARAPAKAMGEACAVSGAKIDGQSAAKTDGSNNEPDLTVEQALSLKQAMAFEQIRFLAEVKELAQVLKSRK